MGSREISLRWIIYIIRFSILFGDFRQRNLLRLSRRCTILSAYKVWRSTNVFYSWIIPHVELAYSVQQILHFSWIDVQIKYLSESLPKIFHKVHAFYRWDSHFWGRFFTFYPFTLNNIIFICEIYFFMHMFLWLKVSHWIFEMINSRIFTKNRKIFNSLYPSLYHVAITCTSRNIKHIRISEITKIKQLQIFFPNISKEIIQ